MHLRAVLPEGLSTSDTTVPSREDKTHVPEASAATLVQNGSTKGGDAATGQTFVVESPPANQNGRDSGPAESQTLIAPADGSPDDTDGAYRFGATVVAGGAAGQDYSLGATLVGDSAGVGNGDEFQMGATVAAGDDPAALATRIMISLRNAKVRGRRVMVRKDRGSRD